MIIKASAQPDAQKMLVSAEVKGKVGILTIDGHIASWNENSSSVLRLKINDVVRGKAKRLVVNLNSPGGDVFAAREIANMIDENFNKVKVRIGALAASAGSYLSSRFRCSARKNSQIMIHKPSAGAYGNEDELKSRLKLLKDATDDYRQVYADKTGKSTEDIEKLWKRGDHWMTAEEALKEGFIDEIEDADKKITAHDVAMLAACGAPITPTVTSINNQNIMDKELLIATLGLEKGATDGQITAKIEELKKDAAKATNLQAELDQQKKNNKTAKVKALLDQAEKDKKITGENRAHYEKLANADFDSTKEILESIAGAQPISGQINPSAKGGEGSGEAPKGRENWTLADYQEKDPQAFDKLSDDKQEELVNAHYADNE